MEKEKLYSLEVAIEALQTFYLNALHKEKKIKMKIKTPPMENVLAWFDPNDDGLYITSDLSRWSPELLYVLPLHENTHKVLHGLVENYENGYHNIAFRDFFEKYSGMRTYHDEKLGWQFIQDVGDKYIAWLEKQKEVLNEIFRIIKNTDLPKKENEQEGEQEGENGGQEGESEAEKMNKILRQNSGDQDGEQEAGESNEQSGQEGEQEGGQSDGESNEKSDQESDGESNEQSDEQKNDQEGESGDQESESNEQSGNAYEGQKQDVVLKGGRKKFRL
jgi:hypothetical protein